MYDRTIVPFFLHPLSFSFCFLYLFGQSKVRRLSSCWCCVGCPLLPAFLKAYLSSTGLMMKSTTLLRLEVFYMLLILSSSLRIPVMHQSIAACIISSSLLISPATCNAETLKTRCFSGGDARLLQVTQNHFTSLHLTSLHLTQLNFTSLHFTSLKAFLRRNEISRYQKCRGGEPRQPRWFVYVEDYVRQ